MCLNPCLDLTPFAGRLTMGSHKEKDKTKDNDNKDHKDKKHKKDKKGKEKKKEHKKEKKKDKKTKKEEDTSDLNNQVKLCVRDILFEDDSLTLAELRRLVGMKLSKKINCNVVLLNAYIDSAVAHSVANPNPGQAKS